MSDYISPPKAAEMLGCSLQSVYRHLKAGRLTGKRGRRSGRGNQRLIEVKSVVNLKSKRWEMRKSKNE